MISLQPSILQLSPFDDMSLLKGSASKNKVIIADLTKDSSYFGIVQVKGVPKQRALPWEDQNRGRKVMVKYLNELRNTS